MSITTLMSKFQKWLDATHLDTKDHQLEGMKWILTRETEPSVGPLGGFVCDEMGLGKTILMLGAIVSNFKSHNLIVLPLAILEQWRTVIKKLFGHDALIYHGFKAKSIDLDALKAAPVVLTTYGMIATRKKSYISLLWKVEWDRLIFDEAHHMRNAKSNTFHGALRLKAPIKWMVTGTPVNNKKNDFYNLCCIQGLDITFRSSPENIRGIIRECVLKRSKKQVGIKMPKLTFYSIPVYFESKEEEILARNIHNLMNFAPVTHQNVDTVIQSLSSSYENCLPKFMLMRQVCVLPNLATDLLRRRAGILDWDLDTYPLIDSPTSSKINAVVNKIISNKNTGKRKLIFCQFRREIREIKKRIDLSRYE